MFYKFYSSKIQLLTVKKKKRRISGNIYFMLKMLPPSLLIIYLDWKKNADMTSTGLTNFLLVSKLKLAVSDVLVIRHFVLNSIWPPGFVDKNYFFYLSSLLFKNTFNLGDSFFISRKNV